MAQLAIDARDKHDYSLVNEFYTLLQKPYDEQNDYQMVCKTTRLGKIKKLVAPIAFLQISLKFYLVCHDPSDSEQAKQFQ